ncbi:MAG: ECF transporter S component [Candidatus Gastranaerophilales bacterium]|nr:ECF transporter S component [Candidatus Gastranaerophilales bacterium]
MKIKFKETETKKERKKSYTLLIIGATLLVASLFFSVYAYHSSYTASLTMEDAAEKLRNQRPYSYGLTVLFLSILLTVKGLYNALIGQREVEKADIKRLAQAGLLAALCYIGFTFFKIDIPVGTEKTSFHFGNVFCVLAALLLGGYWGGLAGAVGMTIGDLTTSYVTSAPKTFLLKLLIGLIVGLAAHKIFKLSRSHSPKYVTGVTIFASSCGMVFNIVADPLVGYFYKSYLLGVPQEIASALAKLATLTSAVNAVIAVIAATIIYLALRPALEKAGLFIQVTPERTTSGQAAAEQETPEQAAIGQATAEQEMSEPAAIGQTTTGQAESESSTIGQTTTELATPEPAAPEQGTGKPSDLI